MSDTIVRHRIHDGITEDDLTIVRGGRVVVIHRLCISIEQPLNLWQFVNELQRQFLGRSIDLLLCRVLAVLTELESMGYLFYQ